jgi:hypothetical protein
MMAGANAKNTYAAATNSPMKLPSSWKNSGDLPITSCKTLKDKNRPTMQQTTAPVIITVLMCAQMPPNRQRTTGIATYPVSRKRPYSCVGGLSIAS